MRNAFISTIHGLSKDDKDLMVLVADNGAIVFDQFRKDFPNQFLNCGIAEANMIGVAAGMAMSGKRPYIYTITNFMTMRAFEQIRCDICLHNADVKVVGIGGGFKYSTLGPTHHAIEDVALMRALPNMTVIWPASPIEVKLAVKAIAKIEGPVYLRMGTNREPEVFEKEYPFEIGKAVQIKEGTDVTIVVAGPLAFDVLKAYEILEKEGINTRIIDMHTVKPIDKEIILKAAKETGAIITVENHSIIGGLGSAVAEVLAEDYNGNVRFKRLGIRDEFCLEYGSDDDLKKHYRLDALSLVDDVKRWLE